ncbi:NupC/NupG family nucleoside CNT transporter [Desulforegula conservatrix]|uniref:NupC/NupG family nucleoside CNT transporter n=1 Tax=Desulforegula conservatrix TaxID=153026 RepID=UPI000427236C|nr:nucleoside transporter C-terminal domain-containing protein [Desulforegula conservatrix]
MRFQGVLGLVAILFIAWIFSENRHRISLRGIVSGFLLQFFMAFLILKIPLIKDFLHYLDKAVIALETATTAGTSFVFGYLGGGTLPFDEKVSGLSYILGFRGLVLVLVVSALSSLLFYWKVLPLVVRAFSYVLRKTLGIGGAVGLGAAANVFLGMIESPLFVKPYLKDMSRSELFVTMTCGMAGIAGTVMILYASILKNKVPDVLGHILVASLISIPAAIMISQIMVPETKAPTEGDITPPQLSMSAMDAITKGTAEGINLLINIIAMLVVLVALVHLANQILGFLPELAGQPVTLQRILGYIMAPMAWLIGIPWYEAQTAGMLLGTKTVLNEFVAYLDMAALPEGSLCERSRLIMTYALCGFANLGSLGIMIGGMGAMVPERRDEIVELGMRSIFAGTLSTCMIGAVVGLIQ